MEPTNPENITYNDYYSKRAYTDNDPNRPMKHWGSAHRERNPGSVCMGASIVDNGVEKCVYPQDNKSVKQPLYPAFSAIGAAGGALSRGGIKRSMNPDQTVARQQNKNARFLQRLVALRNSICAGNPVDTNWSGRGGQKIVHLSGPGDSLSFTPRIRDLLLEAGLPAVPCTWNQYDNAPIPIGEEIEEDDVEEGPLLLPPSQEEEDTLLLPPPSQ